MHKINMFSCFCPFIESWVQIKERTHETKVLLALLFLYDGHQYYAKVDGNNVVVGKNK